MNLRGEIIIQCRTVHGPRRNNACVLQIHNNKIKYNCDFWNRSGAIEKFIWITITREKEIILRFMYDILKWENESQNVAMIRDLLFVDFFLFFLKLKRINAKAAIRIFGECRLLVEMDIHCRLVLIAIWRTHQNQNNSSLYA